MALKNNTWKVNQWYDQNVAGNVSYSGAGRLYAAGDPDDYGQLGLNSRTKYSSPVQIPGTNWRQLGVGQDEAVIATKTDGTMWAWGRNTWGNLGLNQAGPTTTKYSSPTQVPGTTWALSTATGSVAGATKTDGTMWAWGYNGMGALGQNTQGNPTSRSSPVQVGSDTTWSSDSFDKLGGSFGAIMTIKTDGTLWAWGRNEFGVLGINAGHDSHRSSPVQIPGTTWSVVCEPSDSGTNHTFVINTSGELFAVGRNDSGNLGLNNRTNYSSPVQIPGTTWRYVTTGARHTMASKTDGTLWSWGYNGSGRLGLNQPEATFYSSPVQIPGTTWNRAFSGNASCWATKTDGTLWAWGYNGEGSLCQNNRTYYSSPVQVGSNTDWIRVSSPQANGLLALTNT